MSTRISLVFDFKQDAFAVAPVSAAELRHARNLLTDAGLLIVEDDSVTSLEVAVAALVNLSNGDAVLSNFSFEDDEDGFELYCVASFCGNEDAEKALRNWQAAGVEFLNIYSVTR
ncbi:MAG: hypothetical protein FOGNACKC_00797 [Anaerolineae bacterium]|nr:hypothetical protein [Anaerolineae bacterium]